MIENRIRKNLKRLKSHDLLNQTNAFRLYDLDIPEYPFMADFYANNIVVHDRRNERLDDGKNNLEEFFEALKNIFPEVENIFLKRRKNQDRFEKYSKFNDQKKEFKITENNINFIVNLSDYIDTGLFLDHRPLRKWVFKESKQKKVLNLFSYTCSISTSAAVGGASQVTSIDLSKKYLDWGRENFIANNISPDGHRFISADIMESLDELNEYFDLIICDPPTFSNSKKMKNYFDVQQDHVFLINQCLGKLTKTGKLYFSCNKRDFKLQQDELESQNVTIKDLTKLSIPPDFNNQKIHQCFSFQLNN